MKKLLFLFLLATGFKSFAQSEASVQLPIVDSIVSYESSIKVPSKTAFNIYDKVLDWYLRNFNSDLHNDLKTNDGRNSKLLAHVGILASDKSITSTPYNINFTIQVTCKDGVYWYAFYHIRHTVEGKDSNSLFAKYLVNIKAEDDIKIVSGEKTGYSNSQKKEAQKVMLLIDKTMKDLAKSLISYVENP